MAIARIVSKNQPRTKVMVPSKKWKIAFSVSLVINLIQLALFLIKR